MPRTELFLAAARILSRVPRAKSKIQKSLLLKVIVALESERPGKGLTQRKLGIMLERDARTVRDHLDFAETLGWAERYERVGATRWGLTWPFLIYVRDRVGLERAVHAAVRKERAGPGEESGPRYLSHFDLVPGIEWDIIEGRFVGCLKAVEALRNELKDRDPRLMKRLKVLEEAAIEAATLRHVVVDLERTAPEAHAVIEQSETEFHEIIQHTKRDFEHRHRWPVTRHGRRVNW